MSKYLEVKDLKLSSLTWPLVVTFLLSLLMPVIDSWFLSRVSDLAAAAVGAVIPVLATVKLTITSMTQAGVSIASQYMGGRRYNLVNTTYVITLGLCLVMGGCASAFLFTLSDQIGFWLGLTADGNQFSSQYLYVLSPLFFCWALMEALSQIIASRGRTFLNMLGMILVNLSNISLNYLFYEGVFGANFTGVRGVALATVISFSLGILYSFLLLRYTFGLSFQWLEVKERFKSLMTPIARIGIPSSIEPVSFQLYQVVVTMIVVSLGEFALTTRIYTFNLVLFTMTTSLALGISTRILVAHLVGAKDYDRAHQQLHKSLGAGALMAFLLVGFMWIFAPNLIGLFTDNERILTLARKLLLIELILEPARVFNIVLTQSLSSSGDAKFPAFFGALLMWTIGLGLVYALGISFEYGLVGVWWGLCIDECVRAAYNYSRWQKGIWRQTGVNEHHSIQEVEA